MTVTSKLDVRRYLDDPVLFVKEQIVLSNGQRVGEAMAKDEWVELDLLRPIFARDANGLPKHRLLYFEYPRGHWKTGGVAASGVTEAVTHDSTDVVVAAADEDQAKILLDNIAGYVARNPLLAAAVKQRAGEFIVPRRGSRIRVISSDVPSSWGLGGTHKRFRVYIDELTAWPDKGEELWIALVSATAKVPDTQTVVISTAGIDPDRAWQWRVRQMANREPWAKLYTTDGVLASWVTDDRLDQMEAALPPAAFRRLFLNEWIRASGDFVSEEQWLSCIDANLRPRSGAVTDGTGTPIYKYVVGCDLGLRRDRSAIAVLHREQDRIVLDELLVFTPARNHPVSPTVVHMALQDVARRYPGANLIADRWNLELSMEQLQPHFASVEAWTFGGGNWKKLADALYQAITSAQLRVFDDDALTQEMLGLRTIVTANGWRFDHARTGFSDRATAIAMAIATLPGTAPADLYAGFHADPPSYASNGTLDDLDTSLRRSGLSIGPLHGEMRL